MRSLSSLIVRDMLANDVLSVWLPVHQNVIFKFFEPLAKIGAVFGLFPFINIRGLKTSKFQKGKLSRPMWFVLTILFIVVTVIDVICCLSMGDLSRLATFYDASVVFIVVIHRFFGVVIWIQFVTKSGQLMGFFKSWSTYPLSPVYTEENLKNASLLITMSFLFSFGLFSLLQALSMFSNTSMTHLIVADVGHLLSFSVFRAITTSIYFSYQIFLLSFASYFLYVFAWCLSNHARESKAHLSTSCINDHTLGERMKRSRLRYLRLCEMLRKFETILSPGLTLFIAHFCVDMCLTIYRTCVAIMKRESWFTTFSPGGYVAVRFVPLAIVFWLADHAHTEVRRSKT